MTPDDKIEALSADLVALEAVVRAIARTQARRSPTALGDLLQSLETEAERLGGQADLPGDMGQDEARSARAVIDGWIEQLKDEAMAA